MDILPDMLDGFSITEITKMLDDHRTDDSTTIELIGGRPPVLVLY
jgi:DNA-binding transcriptional MerR regulator